ncbi:sensor domain-containing diguanylate cyclase [Ferrimonas aestuarii]|uniref:diguanylate cyclase n=1 Tax=Ferrimonas aestuarii TaxID=2569539 RepID=A0A4U1BNH6_9GAMM|nr:sensor domain-containing diguanylate cyclase [Ferrimonas aestuarii]TKB55052.1 sensor domain-containing diguanylate cyclase [Ferrimonas aestuarii]
MEEVQIIGALESHAQKQWVHLLNMLSQATGMQGAYLSRCDSKEMRILATNDTCPKAVQAGEQFSIFSLYCEQVMKTGRYLSVDDAWADPKWANSRETDAGIISYLGLPVRQPNGYLFGTLCIWAPEARPHCHQWLALMQSVVNIIESDLSLLAVGKSLANDSITDPLTGLNNRRGLEQQLDGLLSLGHRLSGKSQDKIPLGMMMLDLDRFKGVNDTYGHIVGDKLLKHFADLIQGAIRRQDLAVRWGGEEFLLLFPAISPRNLAMLAEKIRLLVIASPLMLDQEELAFTVSIGYGGWNQSQLSSENIQTLDEQLLLAKQQGRNRCCGKPLLCA